MIKYESNLLDLLSSEFYLEIAKDSIPKHSSFTGYGTSNSIGVITEGTDIWQGTNTTIPIPSSGGEQISIASTSTQDSSGGAGVRRIHIHYLDINGLEQEEAIWLNGTNAVDSVANDITFIQEMHSTLVNGASGGVALGDITIFKTGNPALVYNIIKAGGNMSLSTSRKIPANKMGYLLGFECSSTGKNRVEVRLRSTDHLGILYPNVFIFKDSANIENSVYSQYYRIPIKIPPLSIIKITAWSTQTGAYVSARYNGILIDITP